jgi:hypothetical protein
MSAQLLASYCDPLDLLRRFVATPLKACISLESARVVLETNDLSFFPSSISTTPPAAADPTLSSCRWKVVRDVDTHQELAEASTVIAGDLLVYSMGPACIIAADRYRKEILAFIGGGVDSCAFRESILPVLLRLTEFVTLPSAAPPNWQQELVYCGDKCNA